MSRFYSRVSSILVESVYNKGKKVHTYDKGKGSIGPIVVYILVRLLGIIVLVVACIGCTIPRLYYILVARLVDRSYYTTVASRVASRPLPAGSFQRSSTRYPRFSIR